MSKNKNLDSVQSKLDKISTIEEFNSFLSEIREKGLFLDEDCLFSLQSYFKNEDSSSKVNSFSIELIDSFFQLKAFQSALEERKKNVSPKWLDKQNISSLLAFAYSYLESRRITDFEDKWYDYFIFSTNFVRALKPVLVYLHELENKNPHRKKVSNDPLIELFEVSCQILTRLSQKSTVIDDFLEIFEIYDAEDQFNNALTFFRKGWEVIFSEDTIQVIAPTEAEQSRNHRIGEKYRLINNWYTSSAIDLYEMANDNDEVPLSIIGNTEKEKDINYSSTVGVISAMLMLADWGISPQEEVIKSLFRPKDDDLIRYYMETAIETYAGKHISLPLGIHCLMQLRANIKGRYGENLEEAKRMSANSLNPYDLILKATHLSLCKDTLATLVQYRTISETAKQIIQDFPPAVKSKMEEIASDTLRFLIPNLYDKSPTYTGLDVLPIFRLGETIVLTHHSAIISSFGPGMINLIIGKLGSKGELSNNLRNSFEERSLANLIESLKEGFPGQCGFKFACEFKFKDFDNKDRDIDLIIYHDGYWLFIEHKWTEVRAEWQSIFTYCENQLEKGGDQLKITREFIFSCADKFKNDISVKWNKDVSLPNPDNSYFLIISTSPEGDYQTYEGFPKVSSFELKVLLLQNKFGMMTGDFQNLNDAKINELLHTTCFSDQIKPNIPELIQAIENDWLWKDLISE